MLGTVSVTANGVSHELRLSMSAMMRVERETGIGIIDVLDAFQAGAPKAVILGHVLAASMGQGKGDTMDAAAALMDALGFVASTKLVGEVLTKAFPPTAQSSEGTPGNPAAVPSP